jgi:hypothetical protein
MKKIYNINGINKIAGRKRIRDRGIHWVEKYGEKSIELKRRYDKKIGDKAYLRWEGHDYTTESDYFVVVGPAKTKYDQKSFFAGIKKLPPKARRKKIYAPSGKYFPSIISAISHASKMWGVIMPHDQPNYTIDDLANINIPRHMKA